MNNNPHYTSLSSQDLQNLLNEQKSYTVTAKLMLWDSKAFAQYCRKHSLLLPPSSSARNCLAGYSNIQLHQLYVENNSFSELVEVLKLSCSNVAVMREFHRRGIRGLYDRVQPGIELGRSNKGHVQSEEERNKHREGVRNWVGHPEHMNKLLKLHTGSIHTEETKQKMALASVNRLSFKGESKLERKFREALEDTSLSFLTQYSLPVARSIADFFFEPNIAVYVDGCFVHACPEHHPELLDWSYIQGKRRLENAHTRSTKNDPNVRINLEKVGYTVLRFWEHDINTDLQGCISKIEQAIQEGKNV